MKKRMLQLVKGQASEHPARMNKAVEAHFEDFAHRQMRLEALHDRIRELCREAHSFLRSDPSCDR